MKTIKQQRELDLAFKCRCCGQVVEEKRAALGYDTCLKCSEKYTQRIHEWKVPATSLQWI